MIYLFKALLFFALINSAFSADRLVLMTSLDPQVNIPVGRSRNWNINKKLETIFVKRLGHIVRSSSDIKVIHFATAEDVSRELSDSKNKAVFWVSHSNGAQSGQIIEQNTIIDYQGKDLSEVFQNPSSKLQYLAFVGCRADYTLQKYKDMRLMNNNKNLKTYSRIKKVDARKALKRAIKDYLFKLNREELSQSKEKCKLSKKHTIKLRRDIPADLPPGKVITSIKIIQRGIFLGLFPLGQKGETQEISIELIPGESKRDIKLVFDSGIASQDIEMGKIQIINANYKVFSNRIGLPFGKGRFVYNFIGNLSDMPKPNLTKNLNCIDHI